jgi:hypothetical protein
VRSESHRGTGGYHADGHGPGPSSWEGHSHWARHASSADGPLDSHRSTEMDAVVLVTRGVLGDGLLLAAV